MDVTQSSDLASIRQLSERWGILPSQLYYIVRSRHIAYARAVGSAHLFNAQQQGEMLAVLQQYAARVGGALPHGEIAELAEEQQEHAHRRETLHAYRIDRLEDKVKILSEEIVQLRHDHAELLSLLQGNNPLETLVEALKGLNQTDFSPETLTQLDTLLTSTPGTLAHCLRIAMYTVGGVLDIAIAALRTGQLSEQDNELIIRNMECLANQLAPGVVRSLQELGVGVQTLDPPI